ncbi:hypothetical protein M271_13940 [Streptomyces rapamycinicus NRRL 5491]|nr:hypothetical protein M271_13940 [Streptomyces rapamycinicus NRRL 5491]
MPSAVVTWTGPSWKAPPRRDAPVFQPGPHLAFLHDGEDSGREGEDEFAEFLVEEFWGVRCLHLGLHGRSRLRLPLTAA